MTPWELAKDSESSHQKALFAWANCAARYGFDVAGSVLGYSEKDRAMISALVRLASPVPALDWLFAIPNGGKRDPITAARMKAEGVKAGVPDIMLPVSRGWFQYHAPDQIWTGLFIELKKPSAKPKRSGAGGVAENQSEWHAYLVSQGYRVVVAYGWEDAAKAIQEYMQYD